MNADCHVEHAVSFTGAPEHHRNDCAWCALVREERALREALLNG